MQKMLQINNNIELQWYKQSSFKYNNTFIYGSSEPDVIFFLKIYLLCPELH